MRLFEYQGKDLFSQYGIRIPTSYVAESLEEARKSASKLGYPVVLKSQLSVGGRGKAGAILKCKNASELLPKFDELINKKVKGELPRGILVEEVLYIKKELYLSFFLNRSRRCYSLIASAEGGMEIESVDSKVIFDIPLDGLSPEVAVGAAKKLGLNGVTPTAFVDFTMKLSKMVMQEEAELAEVNPMAVLSDGSLIALDAKVIIDDNAMFRHVELKKYEHISELEEQAGKSGFS